LAVLLDTGLHLLDSLRERLPHNVDGDLADPFHVRGLRWQKVFAVNPCTADALIPDGWSAHPEVIE